MTFDVEPFNKMRIDRSVCVCVYVPTYLQEYKNTQIKEREKKVSGQITSASVSGGQKVTYNGQI
jgi:hypothetical protein